MVHMFLRGLKLKNLFYYTTKAIELLLGIILQDQLADKLQQALHSGSFS